MVTSKTAAVPLLALAALTGACNKAEKFTTTITLERAQAFGSSDRAPSVMDVELAYTECPGQPIAVVRGDRNFAECAKALKVGDKIPAEVTFTYVSDRAQYRSDVTKVGDCERKPDPKDDATYDLLHNCKDVMIHGVNMGVHCDKTRSAELVAKCPWFKRR